MMDETPGEMAMRLDPMSDLSKAIVDTEREHVQNMTTSAANYIFGAHLAMKDGMLTAAEMGDFIGRLRAVVQSARHLSAQHLYDIRDEMQETVQRAAATREAQKEAGAKSPSAGPTLN